MSGDRSPNYPIISLADAIGRVQLIYEKERQHPADKLVMAKALGYGSLNGLSRSILSALVKFGLLIEDNNQLKVSMDALDVVLHSAGQPERMAAIQRAASMPPLFSELRATFDGSLPSDENLRAFLVKKGFNPNTVSNVIRSYRDTVLFANQEAAQGGEATDTRTDSGESAIIGVKTPGTITMFPATSAPIREGLELAFNLSPGCHAKMVLTGDVTQADIRKLQAFLDLSMDTFPHRPVVQEAALDGDLAITGG